MKLWFRGSLLWLVGSLAIGCVTVRGSVQPEAPQTPDPNLLIEAVEIRGNRRVPSATIRSNIETKPGTILNANLVRRDIRILMSLGDFDRVWVEEEDGEEGRIVIFHVREKP